MYMCLYIGALRAQYDKRETPNNVHRMTSYYVTGATNSRNLRSILSLRCIAICVLIHIYVCIEALTFSIYI